MPFFYLSFCDNDRPEGSRFLGATVVEASDVKEAHLRSHELKVNPGGEVLILKLDKASISEFSTAELKFIDKLVSPEEIRQIDSNL